MSKLFQKLLKIQEAVLGLSKNKKGFGFDYVTGNKVLDYIKPLMNENGIILKQEVLSIDNIRVDYATKNGNKSEMNSKVMMKFTWVDCDTGEKDENLFGANGQNDWDKGVGSALTYGERYFLLKYFHIATDQDDIDNPDRKKEIKSAPVVEKEKAVAPIDDLKKALAACKSVEELNSLYKSMDKPTPAMIELFATRKKGIAEKI